MTRLSYERRRDGIHTIIFTKGNGRACGHVNRRGNFVNRIASVFHAGIDGTLDKLLRTENISRMNPA